MDSPIQLAAIYRARKKLVPYINRTPCNLSPSLTSLTGHNVYLKLESMQKTGSFKLRGALNAVLGLSASERQRGIIGVSTGNYGRALAYAAQLLGLRAVICMSELVPENKVQAIADLGAEIHIAGNSQDEADKTVTALQKKENLIRLPPFDHPDVIAGQGTCGLEIIEDLPRVDTVLVPLSGGGLLAGVALAIKATNPACRVIGITMENGCAMHQSLKAGHPVAVEEVPSLADSLGGGIGLDNRYTFNMVKQWVDETILVTEQDIAAAIVHAYRHDRLVVEGAGAVGRAALLSKKIQLTGNTVTIVSGKNIDMDHHLQLISTP